MKKSTKGAAAVIILLLLLFNPVLASEGAKSGLLLWSQTVLPALLPFMICSNVIVALDAIHLLTGPFQPVLKNVLRLSPAGSYILISGLLCGYPMGAKTCSEFLDDGRITRPEASYLLSICNHPSPMFLLGYVAGSINGTIPTALLLASLYLPIFLLSVISRTIYGIHRAENSFDSREHTLSFDRTMMSSIEVMVKIGGYIMLFSILAGYLQKIPLHPAGKAVVLGIVEITTGIQALSAHMAGQRQILAVIAITAFGGMSGIFQTNSVISDASKNAGLSIRHYIMWKLFHSLLSCMTFILLWRLLPWTH